MAFRFNCSSAHGPDQGLNLYLLNWQADSLLLSHQGSPRIIFDYISFCVFLEIINIFLFSFYFRCDVLYDIKSYSCVCVCVLSGI